jgi:hypothetical protein
VADPGHGARQVTVTVEAIEDGICQKFGPEIIPYCGTHLIESISAVAAEFA